MSGRSIPARSRTLVCAVALILGAAGTSVAHADSASSNGTAASPAFKTPRLYVVDSRTGFLTGVDASTGAVRTKAYLNQQRAAGIDPIQMRASHNGRVIYELCNGQGTVIVNGTLVAVDARTDQVIATTPVGNANAFVLSPDGKYAYVTAVLNVFKVDLSTMRVVATFSDPTRPIAPQLSPDGKTLYVADARGKNVLSIDTATFSVKTTTAVASNLNATALSPDGSELYVMDSTRRLTVLNTADAAVVATIAVGPGMTTLNMSPDGSKLYVSGDNAQELDVVKTATNKFNKKIPHTTVHGVQFSPDGSAAYFLESTTATTSTLYTIDPTSQAIRSTLVLDSGSDTGFAVSPDGAQLWVTGFSGTMVVDLKAGKEIATVSSERSQAVGFTGGTAGTAFVGDVSTSAVEVFSTSTFKQLAIVPCEFRYPTAVTVTPDGSTAYVGSLMGSTVRAVDLLTGKPTVDITAGDAPTDLATTPDGAYVLAANYFDSTLSVIATSTNEAVATVPIPDGAIFVRVSPDGRTAYVLGSDALTFVDLTTFQVTAKVPLSDSDYDVDLAVSADGSTAYADGWGGVAVIDTATQTVTHTFAVGSNFSAGMAVSPDNATLYLAVASMAGLPGVLDEVNLATDTISASAPVGPSPTGVVLSSDGSTAYVESGGANTVSVVNTASLKTKHTWNIGTGLVPLDSYGGIFYAND